MRGALAERYEIEGEAGRGGMATVFRARDVKHDRVVAIKVLDPELSAALGAERFLREVRITARLSHPHILPLLDSGEADALLYYVMPFVEGETLRDRLQREGQLPVGEALRLVREVGEALGAAHRLGIVHRDIKPENVLLQGGHALVADFGIARALGDATTLTQTGMALGTPLYMSPEQAHAEVGVDGRTDQYALGCVAFEMLTGEPPYTGPTPMAITARKLTEPVPPLRSRRETVPPALEATITRALARTPADRFATMEEFMAAIPQSAAEGRPATAGVARWWRPVAAALLLAVVGTGAWLTRRAPAPVASTSQSTVAVLPFQNLSPDPAQAYFADGLADEVVTSLSMVPGVRVASRTSTAALLGRQLDVKALAERLDVETVLEGSLRVSGERVRVTSRLVKVADGFTMWSQTYERNAADVLRIQEEIATAIVGALRGQLAPEHRDAVSSGTTDPEAYDLYLQARALRLRQSEQGLRRAAELFEAALARAPGFARAQAGLAETFAVQGWYDYQPPREAFPRALETAAQSLRLDPRNASAQATIAYATLYYEWDLARAEREFKAAIAMDPNSPIAHQWYGNYLAVAQRFAEAEEEFRTALRLEPTAPVRHAVLAWVQAHAGQAERAVQSFREAAAYDSTYAATFQWGAMALEEAGKLDEAVRALEWSVTQSGRGAIFVAGLARVHALQGDRARAEALLREVRDARVVPAYEVAKVYLALGDRGEAMRWLERAFEARSHSMVFLRIDPQLKALRGDAPFEAMARRVGL